MSNLKVFFICLVAASTIRAEFLFEKNVAADDKFLCLHKKLYRREKPATSSNPARILSQMRVLQSSQAIPPADMPAEYIPDYNGLFTYIYENIGFRTTLRSINDYCTELYNRGYVDFFKSDDFKIIVKDAIDTVYNNLKNNNQLASTSPTSAAFRNLMGNEVQAKINQMMKDYLSQPNIDQAVGDGISYNKVVYVMLNVLSLFKEDVKIARTAYEDAYSSNKDQVKGTEAINSAAVIRWIESIKTRYAQLKANPTPDTQEILEPYLNEGFIAPEVPSGNFIEPISTPAVPQPGEINEPEPTTPIIPVVNESLLIEDMIIEIQRTYNVHKMLIAYNQLPQSLRSDIDSCKLNLAAAVTRCESIHGAGNCEAISGAAVHQKCPTGTVRQGCCKCVAECDSNLYYTTARGFCKHKNDLHVVPAMSSASSASNGQTVVSGLNIAVSACNPGFALNKFLCYRSCPVNTRAIGGATCLKEKPTILGSPFVWAAGDE